MPAFQADVSPRKLLAVGVHERTRRRYAVLVDALGEHRRGFGCRDEPLAARHVGLDVARVKQADADALWFEFQRQRYCQRVHGRFRRAVPVVPTGRVVGDGPHARCDVHDLPPGRHDRQQGPRNSNPSQGVHVDLLQDRVQIHRHEITVPFSKDSRIINQDVNRRAILQSDVTAGPDIDPGDDLQARLAKLAGQLQQPVRCGSAERPDARPAI